MPNDETMRSNVVDLIALLAKAPSRNEALTDTIDRAKAVSRLLTALARYDKVHSDEWDDDDEDED